MLSTFIDYPIIIQTQLLYVDIETLKVWYTKYPQVYHQLNNPLTLRLLSQQYKVLTPGITSFPEFYTQYYIKYHPIESNIPSHLIKSIAINNDDPIALLNLLSINDRNRKIVTNGLLPEDVIMVLRSKFIKLNLIHVLENDNRLNAKHMIRASKGLSPGDLSLAYLTDKYRYVVCAVSCGYFDEIIGNDDDDSINIQSLSEGLVIGSSSVEEYEKQIDKFIQCGRYTQGSIICSAVRNSCRYDRLDFLMMLKFKYSIQNKEIFNGCKLSSTKILQWIYDQEPQLFIDFPSIKSDTYITVKTSYGGPYTYIVPETEIGYTCVNTLKWLFDIGILDNISYKNIHILIHLCSNEDVESVVYLMNRIKMADSDIDRLSGKRGNFPSNINYFLSRYFANIKLL